MSVSFDWDFRDESAQNGGPDGNGPRFGRVRRWLIRGFVAVVILLIVGLPIRAWLATRLESIEKDEERLRSLIELEIKTIAENDRELFRSLQDPDDPNWQERQLARFAPSNAAEFVPAPGLAPAGRPPEIDRVHFFGDSGRVEMTVWFVDETPRGEPEAAEQQEPLEFHVTWFYRQDEAGDWYHVEAPGDYWGVPYSWHGKRLEVRATEVEAERLDAVARETAIMISQACLWMGCPEDSTYVISFEDIPHPEIRGNVWALPALYITGLPDGDAALEAWRRALKLWAVEMLATAQAGDDALTQRVVFDQLLKRLQDRLHLINGPADLTSRRQIRVLSEAAADREQHPMWSLWQVRMDPDGPENAELLEAEVNALLEYIEGEVGSQRLFQLLPALGEHVRLSDALQELYNVDPVDFSSGWTRYLEGITGVQAGPGISSAGQPMPEGPLKPPPLPQLATSAPGEHMALICDGRIWVADGDGSGLVPLTARDQTFTNVFWSPDGRWLLTTWQPNLGQPLAGLYLLAADGSEARLLTDDPATQAWSMGWDPQGTEAIYVALSLELAEQSASPQMRAIDIETGEARDVPGLPAWSPDGEKLVYVTLAREGPAGSAWVADADWGNPQLFELGAWMWPSRVWSPDSSLVALALPGHAVRRGGGTVSAVGVFDVDAERALASITVTELSRMLEYPGEGAIPGDSSLTEAERDALTWATVLGWSADGGSILVAAQNALPAVSSTGPAVLAAVPLQLFRTTAGQGSPNPTVVAHGQHQSLDAIWSPVAPDLLVFWSMPGSQDPDDGNGFLFDLRAGSIYTATNVFNASWSPDGEWVAFSQQGGATIIDKAGQKRFELGVGTSTCYDVAWNPAADLSQLGETLRPETDDGPRP
jgi:Tol biopolymer transport system component